MDSGSVKVRAGDYRTRVDASTWPDGTFDVEVESPRHGLGPLFDALFADSAVGSTVYDRSMARDRIRILSADSEPGGSVSPRVDLHAVPSSPTSGTPTPELANRDAVRAFLTKYLPPDIRRSRDPRSLWLAVHVDRAGKPAEVFLEFKSGDADLDKLVLDATSLMRFRGSDGYAIASDRWLRFLVTIDPN